MAELPNRTLGRGLAMLELLSQRPVGMKLYEIADALGLARSTGVIWRARWWNWTTHGSTRKPTAIRWV